MLPIRRNNTLTVSRNSRNVLLTNSQGTLPLNRTSSSNISGNLVRPAGHPLLPSRLRLSRSYSAESHGDGPPRLYLIGARLDCKIPVWSRYHSGKVAAVNFDGTLMVRFDDGDLRDCVQLADVYLENRVSLSSSPQKAPLEIGSQIEYAIDQKWFLGRVIEITGHDRFTIVLCDQRTLRDVSRDVLRVYKPVPGHLIAGEEVEFLVGDTRSWMKAHVDESLSNIKYFDEVSQAFVIYSIEEVELRYPIVNPPPRQALDEDCLDATPMLLSMQERLSQSIDVGSTIIITDKNGGALPKTGKADSAQVSIINFPLPADGVIESVTLRLFEPPADEATQFDVILFDREQARMTRTHRLSSAESSHDEGGNSPMLGAANGGSADAQIARFYVAPDLPYRACRAQINVNPHSTGVQSMKLSIPLRGSAGQYIGIMNRAGRLNIAYTPDKKKPGESWSEKSVEVFYMMPRMVPRPFIGGPHSTRDWHGRAGWFATMVVSDPVDAVDPGWQRRCVIDALNRRGGHSEMCRLCWLIMTLINQGLIEPSRILFGNPTLMHALRRLFEVDESVVELIAHLCSMTLSSSKIPMQTPNTLRPFIRMQKALRLKAWEMQAVHRGRLLSNKASLQSILRCSLLMRRLLSQVSPPILSGISQQMRYVKVTLQPRPIDAPPTIWYHVKSEGRLFVSHSEIHELRSGDDELMLESDEGSRALEVLLKTAGPLAEGELFFPSEDALEARQWRAWTSPLVMLFKGPKTESGAFQDELLQALGDPSRKKSRSTSYKDPADWLDELDQATVLLQTFASGGLPPKSFLQDRLLRWRQRKLRVHVDAKDSMQYSPEDPPRSWDVSIPGASRLRLEWSSSSRIREPHRAAIVVTGCGSRFYGRDGLPPPIERVENSSVRFSIEKPLPFEPSELQRISAELECQIFPPAVGLKNSNGDPVSIVVERGVDAKYACAKCASSGIIFSCCQTLRDPENNEGRTVSLLSARGTWACGLCVSLQTACPACLLFPHSAVFKPVRARGRASFSSPLRYEAFLRRALVPGMQVHVPNVQDRNCTSIRRFLKLFGESAWTSGIEDDDVESHPLNDISLVADTTGKWSQDAVCDSTLAVNADVPSPGEVPPSESSAPPARVTRTGITFAVNDLGPDILVSNNGMTVTRLRSVAWGTQRLSRFLDPSCGTVTITFRIDRNTSNHLFFGVVAPSFTDWSHRLMEPGAWSIRRDGSTHADGRERSTATADARLISGESLTMIIDMASDVRSIMFTRNGTFLGRLHGIPARVVPAVSFGGSNQIVTITAFTMGAPSNSPILGGGSKADSGFVVDVIPEFDSVDTADLEAYAQSLLKWTQKQDRNLVAYIDQIAIERKLTLSDILTLPWYLFTRHSDRYHFLDSLHQEGLVMDQIGQRFEWIRAFNAAIATALPLLDLSFQDKTDNSLVRNLGDCCHLLFHALKMPMWEDALECTRTEEGQFEVVLDYGRAVAHRHLLDSHGRFSIFGQAFRTINPMPPSRLRMHGQLYRATLRGMRAHDDGGPYRQSFQTYCAELLSSPGLGLFLPCANRINEIHDNRDRWLPNPGAKSVVQLSMFEFVGKLMGIALRNNEYLDLRLPSLVWKWLVNKRPNMDDLRAVDLLFANTIEQLSQASEDDQDIWGEDLTAFSSHRIPLAHVLNFTVYSLDNRLCELVPNGDQRPVSFAQDRAEWIKLATEFKLNEFNEQLEAIRRGLATVVPQRMLILFTWEELELMVCGRPRIDLGLLREMTVYVGCCESDSHIQAFWKVLQSFPEEKRSLYLRFVWGRSRLPASRATWGDAPHKISSFDIPTRQSGTVEPDALLPRSHTCYFSLDLPRYSSEEVLRKKLLFAIENCTEIDADQTTTGNRSAALGFNLDVDVNDEPGMNSSDVAAQGGDGSSQGVTMGVSAYLATMGLENERRHSQSSFGSEFDDFDEEICEAEIEVLARLGHDLEAVNVFEFDGGIDFGDDDD